MGAFFFQIIHPEVTPFSVVTKGAAHASCGHFGEQRAFLALSLLLLEIPGHHKRLQRALITSPWWKRNTLWASDSLAHSVILDLWLGVHMNTFRVPGMFGSPLGTS